MKRVKRRRKNDSFSVKCPPRKRPERLRLLFCFYFTKKIGREADRETDKRRRETERDKLGMAGTEREGERVCVCVWWGRGGGVTCRNKS